MFPSKKSGEKPTQIRGITTRTKARKQAQKDHKKHSKTTKPRVLGPASRQTT
jgi:hypothetical protein